LLVRTAASSCIRWRMRLSDAAYGVGEGMSAERMVPWW
jgi:hypothetical protein